MTSIRNSSITRPGVRYQRGVTLVELMISLLLGLLLTAGIIQVFVGNRATYAFNDGLSRIQENGRFALDHIAYHTRMAGYKGCISDIAMYNNLDTSDAFLVDLDNGIQGHEANGTGVGASYTYKPGPGAWTPGLPATMTTALAAASISMLPGSDVLIVRGISGDGSTMVPPYNISAQLFVAAPTNFLEGEILVATDCQKASLFQVTSVSNSGSTKITLTHAANNSYSPGNRVPPIWGPEQDYGLGAEVARLQTYAFFIGQRAGGRPALFQLRIHRQSATASGFIPEDLVEGIESMQVRYGVDMDKNGAIDDWPTADVVNAAGIWKDVLSVEVTLLARSDEYGSEFDTAVYNLGGTQFNPTDDDDRRLRQVFSTTIGVRNRLP